jgi:hypothetical protein
MNGRRDRRALAGEVRDWRTVSFVGARASRMPVGLACRVRIDVTFRFADDPRRPRPGRDTANLMPAAKALVDGLTPSKPLYKTIEAYGRRTKVQTGATIGYGFVVDDRPAHVDGPHLHIGDPLDWTAFGPTCDVAMRVEVIPPACLHTPRCPAADSRVPEAARAVVYHPEQGWTLLCNGVKLFGDGGVLIPSGPVPALPANRGPALHRTVVTR